MKPILFLICHGIQYSETSDYFFAPIASGIRRFLPSNHKVVFRSINWAKYVENWQNELFLALKKNHRWFVWWVVRIICFLISDTWLFLLCRKNNDKSDLEQKIYNDVKYEVSYFLNNYPDGLVVFGGHSWGSEIMLKMCYEDFPVYGLITWGNVTSYMSGAYEDGGRIPPVKFWTILHHRGDPVSTDMLENKNFKDFVKVIDVTDWRNFLFAHTSYWKSKKVHKEIANILIDISK